MRFNELSETLQLRLFGEFKRFKDEGLLSYLGSDLLPNAVTTISGLGGWLNRLTTGTMSRWRSMVMAPASGTSVRAPGWKQEAGAAQSDADAGIDPSQRGPFPEKSEQIRRQEHAQQRSPRHDQQVDDEGGFLD